MPLLEDSSTGFTLIELLVTIAILSILASITLAAIDPSSLLMRAEDSNKIHDVGSCANAMEIWHVRNHPLYPDTLNDMIPMKDLKAIPPGCEHYSKSLTGTEAWIATTLLSQPEQYGCDPSSINVHWCYQTSTSESGYICDGGNIFDTDLEGEYSCEDIADLALDGEWLAQ